MRVRYETYCSGRLLKVFDQLDVTEAGHPEADGTKFIDGQHRWIIDGKFVADDVAQAMLSAYQAWETSKVPTP